MTMQPTVAKVAKVTPATLLLVMVPWPPTT
jgi:hypothetical protein